MKIQIPIPDIFVNILPEFMERAAYLSQSILRVDHLPEENVIEFELPDDFSEGDALCAACDELVKSAGKWRILKDRELKSNVAEHPLEAEWGQSYEPLRPHYEQAEIEILEWLDRQFVKIAARFGAVLRQYPSTIEAATMERCKYHTNFPQNIFSVFEIPHQYQVIDQIRKEKSGLQHHHFQQAGRFLQPCICYHCYQEWSGATLTGGHVLTAKGTCFRHEISWRVNPLRRLEFTMREIVFVGTAEWVGQIREQILEAVWNFFVELGLAGKIVTAKDPFFFYDDMKKATYQLISNAKYELVASTNGTTSSIASFNACNDLLCDSFEITDSQGAPLHSGCVAFGIDRWMRVFINTYGKDAAHWPARVKEEVLI